MKKMLITLALMLMSIGGFAQTAQEIINSYKDNPGVGFVELNKMMINLASAAAKTEAEKEALKSVDSITMGIINTDELADEIGKKLEVLEKQGYGKMDASKEDVKAKVYAKGEENYLTEVVILAKAEGHNVISLIKGKISSDQVGSLVK